MTHILVIRFSAFGDIILLSVLFQAIKKNFPHSHLSFLTSHEFTDVHKHNPHIDTFFSYHRKEKFSSLYQQLQQEKFDIVLDAHSSMRSRLLTFLLKRKNKTIILSQIKKYSWFRYFLIHTKLQWNNNFVPKRIAYLNMLTQIKKNADLSTQYTKIYFNNDDKHKTTLLLQHKKNKPAIAISMGASYTGKMWLTDHWLQLIQHLSLHFFLICVGGKGESSALDSQPTLKKNIADFCGKLSYTETACVLSQCDLTICNDTAILHLSEAVQTPVFAFFGPTVSQFGFAPFLPQSKLLEIDVPCRPCHAHGKLACTNPIYKKCLLEITPAFVITAVKQFFCIETITTQ